jgi:DNA-binding NtrC family response regulator/NADPH:quinone reductase-like Zn-dependent oxidoreductase
LEPKGELPQPAWKLDPGLPIYSNEILVRVDRLNLNSASFSQLLMECGADESLVAEKIMNLIRRRGKMHNPVTGTGGMLLGTIEEVGPEHPARQHAAPGQRIVTLVSLTLTPLEVRKVKKIHLLSGQADVEGHAILFETGIFYPLPPDISENVILIALDEAGAPAYTHSLVSPGDTVLIAGAESKIGALCLFAARDKLGKSGLLTAVTRTEQGKKIIENLGIADVVLTLNTNETISASSVYQKKVGNLSDITIDCMNIPGSELFSIMNTKNRGKVYFASLASRYNVAALGAEGMAKDIDLLLYKGYSHGHADYTVSLLRKYSKLQSYLLALLEEKQQNFGSDCFFPSFAGDPVPVSPASLKECRFQPNNFGLVNQDVPRLQGVVFSSQEIRNLALHAIKIAPYDVSILITGETGVGKEIFAELIHKFSKRCNGSLLKLNCAAVPENLLEAELFGYERGAFTGANHAGKIGLFEAARGGTFFLDEIGDMSLALQAKLLRAVQKKEIMRLGGVKAIPIDVRIIAATNKPLKEMVEKGQFRQDLYYRLNVVEIKIPPLRERPDDVEALANYFLVKFGESYGIYNKRFSVSALTFLKNYDWPGNVRELENLVQRLILFTEGNVIEQEDVLFHLGCKESLAPGNGKGENCAPLSLSRLVDNLEKQIIEEACKKGRTTREIAAYLNTSQSTVVRKLKKYGIKLRSGPRVVTRQ